MTKRLRALLWLDCLILLRAGSRMDELPIDQLLKSARAVLTDEVGVAAAVSPVSISYGAPERRTAATSRLGVFRV